MEQQVALQGIVFFLLPLLPFPEMDPLLVIHPYHQTSLLQMHFRQNKTSENK